MNKPSSRTKKRYISFEVISEQKVFKDEIKDSIYNKTLEFLGEEGLSKLGIQLVNENILRVDRNHKNEMIIILSMIRKINNKRVFFNTLKTSGNLIKVKK
ncbi:MAG: Rpp14/Pop5 family protein [Candidatus Nanoarchaeia archaeon]|jgi:ribonuclease P/MRP protein subunit POP5